MEAKLKIACDEIAKEQNIKGCNNWEDLMKLCVQGKTTFKEGAYIGKAFGRNLANSYFGNEKKVEYEVSYFCNETKKIHGNKNEYSKCKYCNTEIN